nr:AAA family ATPase [Mitsuokella multacida]
MPSCYIIEGPTCAGKTTLAKECVKTGRILVPSYCFHVSNVGIKTPPVENLHYFGEHTPARIDGESAMNRQKRILDEYSRHQMNALNRVRNGESIVMDFSTLGIRAFTKALAKCGKIAPVFPTVFLQRPAREFYDFVESLKKSGADVYITVLCPPGRLIVERLAYRNGDDAWDRSLTNKIAIEYQEVAREIMLNIDCS